MTVIPKVVWLLTFSVALTIGGSAAFAKNGSGPGEAKTSGKSGAVSGNAAGRRIAHRPAWCGHKTTGACAVPASGATSGNDSVNRGPGHPALHPK
jgi:hypothetical protein